MYQIFSECVKDYNIWSNKEKQILKKIYENDPTLLSDKDLFVIDDDKKEVCAQIAIKYSSSIKILDLVMNRCNVAPCTKTDVFSSYLPIYDHDYCRYIQLACKYNTNLSVIEHLFDHNNIDPLSTQFTVDDCLSYGCKNKNIEIV